MKCNALLALCFGMLASCNVSSYEQGEGAYSKLVSEMVEAKTGNERLLISAKTDANNVLVFNAPLACSWAVTPDSVYRAILYYNNVGTKITPIAAERVFVMPLTMQKDSIKTDPVRFESAWIGANKAYLNIRIALVSGVQTIENKGHVLSVVQIEDSIFKGRNRVVRCQLSHNQNNIPQFVSRSVFISVPLKNFSKGDTLHLLVPDYNEMITRTFVF